MVKMARRNDWRSRLNRWAAEEQGKPFQWGTTDCAALARAALIEMFGEEIIIHLPRWDNARGAALILQVRGSIGEILRDLGAAQTTVSFMRAGDMVVSAESEEKVGREAVMVCVDGQQCLVGTEEGVMLSAPVPDSVVYSLWEVALGAQ